MVPSEIVYKDMLARLATVSTYDILTEKIESLGLESTWLIPNLGSILFFVGLYILVLIILIIVSQVACCCADYKV